MIILRYFIYSIYVNIRKKPFPGSVGEFIHIIGPFESSRTSYRALVKLADAFNQVDEILNAEMKKSFVRIKEKICYQKLLNKEETMFAIHDNNFPN